MTLSAGSPKRISILRGQLYQYIHHSSWQPRIWFYTTLLSSLPLADKVGSRCKNSDFYSGRSRLRVGGTPTTLIKAFFRFRLSKKFRGTTLNKAVAVSFPILSNLLFINTLRTGLLNCLNARSRGLTFRHRASCI